LQTHFIFFGNSSLSIGSGHIMRLFALAQWVQEAGFKSTFIYKECLEYQIEKIHQAGFATHQIPQNLTLELLLHLAPTHLIIDDYFLSAEEWQLLSNLSVIKVAFDDALNQNSLPVNLIINTSSTASLSHYKKKASQSKLCLGPEYTLLRKEFVEKAQQLLEFKNRKKILITMGGTDVQGLTLPLCQQLLSNAPGLAIDILIGTTPQEKELRELAHAHSQLTLHINTHHVADVMANAGLAISAAGSTLNELAGMQVPTCALICADNQAATLESPYNGTWFETFDFRNFKNEAHSSQLQQIAHLSATVESLYFNYAKRISMHKQAAQAVNINGWKLILDKILHLTST
jgi:UDP-2,4-diacetamido-2,4,6-trideoxy-beta-L-altropyranose hydrolase